MKVRVEILVTCGLSKVLNLIYSWSGDPENCGFGHEDKQELNSMAS